MCWWNCYCCGLCTCWKPGAKEKAQVASTAKRIRREIMNEKKMKKFMKGDTVINGKRDTKMDKWISDYTKKRANELIKKVKGDIKDAIKDEIMDQIMDLVKEQMAQVMLGIDPEASDDDDDDDDGGCCGFDSD
eukprot:67423_1